VATVAHTKAHKKRPLARPVCVCSTTATQHHPTHWRRIVRVVRAVNVVNPTATDNTDIIRVISISSPPYKEIVIFPACLHLRLITI
jgi:hypothetical protein